MQDAEATMAAATMRAKKVEAEEETKTEEETQEEVEEPEVREGREAKDAECHEVGVRQPADGFYADPLSAEGTACDDGNGDTVNDQCDASGGCPGEE